MSQQMWIHFIRVSEFWLRSRALLTHNPIYFSLQTNRFTTTMPDNKRNVSVAVVKSQGIVSRLPTSLSARPSGPGSFLLAGPKTGHYVCPRFTEVTRPHFKYSSPNYGDVQSFYMWYFGFPFVVIRFFSENILKRKRMKYYRRFM